MNERKERPVSDYQLERYLLREGSAAELAGLEQRLADDPVLARRLEDLRRSNEELRRRYPPQWMGRRIEGRMQRGRSGTARRGWSGYRPWAVPAVALVLAVAAVPALFEATKDSPLPAGDREEVDSGRGRTGAAGGGETALRVKGDGKGPRLVIFRKLAGGHERLEDGAPARSGDLVQIAYRSDGLAFGAVLSVDGRGAVTRHLPVSGEEAVPLAPADTLDFAYELDDAPLWERFFLVASDRPFGLAALEEQLAAGDLAPAGDLRLHQFTLKKTGSP